ncbi:EAL domain-containing protein [Kineococcus sp. NUM-3379]
MLQGSQVRAAVAAPARTAALAQLESLLPELREDFARLAGLAAAVTGAAVGCVTLVLPGRVVVAAATDRSVPPQADVPDEASACAHVVAGGEPLVVPDCAADERFGAAPAVRCGDVRFYAGAPLRDAGGHVLGTLCVLDPSPRPQVDDRVAGHLAALAEQGSALLAQRLRRREQEAQRDVLEAVAAGRPLPQVLDRLARHVEALLGPGLLCSVLLLDEDGVTLRDGAGPNLPPAYRAAIDGVRAGEGVGSCGTAVHRRETVVVADIATDPKWAGFRDLAAEHGLASCTSLPVLGADGTVLGTFALYRREAGEAGAPDAATVDSFRDLTRVAVERDRSRRELTRLATRDTVTGLLNRAAFFAAAGDVLARAPAAGTVHALLSCDVDHFKAVNDSLGHTAGDLYLAAVADALGTALRPRDVVCRFAGDGFAVLVPDVPPATARVVAERVTACFTRPVRVPGHTIELSASVGLSTTELSGTADLDVLLRDADLAMRHAKRSGRARVQACDGALRARASARLRLDLALRQAVGTDALHLVYQPEVDTVTGELVGFEALLRWTSPGLGTVSPADFIPVAEENGLIVEIGRRVLLDACRQLASWRAGHPATRGVTMWVNVSPHQLADPGFVATVTDALDATGLPGAALGLEITETAVMADPEAARATLTRLRRLGVRVALDDFGTGYSSLAVLKSLPVDVVKVDRSFVRGLGQDLSDTRLVAAIVSMAHALDLSVVAEGVEEEGQHAVLRELGCEVSQGYLFGRPVPAADLGPVLAAGSPVAR